MREQVVHADGRHRILEGLERHTVIAGGQPQLFLGQRLDRRSFLIHSPSLNEIDAGGTLAGVDRPRRYGVACPERRRGG